VQTWTGEVKMAIEIIGSKLPSIVLKKEAPKSPAAEFGNLLTDFIGSVNKDQMDASKITQKFVNGDNVEIHDVMIAGEKARTSLELLMEIRNKTVDMYKELTRMSV
jgi:flagellar hook-basal body complex protein FliE